VGSELWEKVHIFGTNKKVWMAALERYGFDFSKLPPAAGGTANYKGMEYEDHAE
jgi:hypothetical protein